ncbi:MAG TPA: glycosyltransferase [Pseudolabrys sp.]|nr:glycosyltransferase [Pseudolabrys sp.]
MASGVGAEAARVRSRASFGAPHGITAEESYAECPELACVRDLLPADVLETAAGRATVLGTGADRVLIATGAIDEETYLRALAQDLGAAFDPLDHATRAMCPLGDGRLIESAAQGMLPLTVGGDLALVVAPRAGAARRIAAMVKHAPALTCYFRFTTADRLNRFAMQCAGDSIAARAAEGLRKNAPVLSAAPPRWRGQIGRMAAAGLALLAAALVVPEVTMGAVEILLASIFLAWLGLRLIGTFAAPSERGPAPRLSDDQLPTYTLIAALYREASSVGGLLSAIKRLDYPREKLNVIIAIEADDLETRTALEADNSRLPITVIQVPPGGPRTKPKALNVALTFARGAFTVVYDAEDRPEPDQLRRALQAFDRGGRRLACVQARLSIDNTADGILTRLFTAEYAGQFDVFLPGIAALRLPLPLGGSSNHFRTEILREVGAWDPYNVTEDADLGFRLARFGYRTGMIASTTYEEAPAGLAPWLRQRTRWFKGWMQTWLVHMRKPRQLMRELGAGGFVTFQLIVGGNALAALVHPLFAGGVIYSVASGSPLWRGDNLAVAVFAAIYGASAVIGYLTSAFLGWLGLLRRGLMSTAWVLLLTPLHWLLLSLAAWRALYQLIAAPYAWEKTEHGLARSSRLNAAMTRALLELERHLSDLQRSGKLPAVRSGATDIFSDRPRHPRAAA